MSFGHDDLSLAVNVSARSLHNRKFAAMVLDCLAESGFAASRLELEITERAFATDTERMALTLAQLRALGIRISIDDFGTGYSSFAALRAIDADRLKIDQQFVRRIGNQPEDLLVVEAIVQLAHGLGMEVVAEGVESIDARDALIEMGCRFGQGFMLARPMPPDETKRRLDSWAAASYPAAGNVIAHPAATARRHREALA